MTVYRHVYVTTEASLAQFIGPGAGATQGWKLDGTEGFVHPPSVARPAGTLALCRGVSAAASGDYALFWKNSNSCGSFTDNGSAIPGAKSGRTYSNGVLLGWAYRVDNVSNDTDNDGMPDRVEALESRNKNVKDNLVLTNTRWFVQQLYRDFYRREFDTGGLNFWVGEINANRQTRATTAAAFLNAGEFNNLIGPMIRLYWASFKRIPEYAGFDYWVNQYAGGRALDEIANFFANSPEFTIRYGSNITSEAYVNNLYLFMLERSADAGGLAYWVGQLDSGACTRGQVMLQFSNSPEGISKWANQNSVIAMFYALLVTQPTDLESTNYTSRLNGGEAQSSIINELIAQPRYRNRFCTTSGSC